MSQLVGGLPESLFLFLSDSFICVSLFRHNHRRPSRQSEPWHHLAASRPSRLKPFLVSSSIFVAAHRPLWRRSATSAIATLFLGGIAQRS